MKKVANSAKLAGKEGRLLLTISCNAFWTRTRAAKAGYVVDSTLCAMCGLHEDTVHLNAWHCQHPDAVAARAKAAPPSVIEAAKRAGPGSALYNRGLFSHPACSWPAPEVDVKFKGHSNLPRSADGSVDLGGNVFIDGSADQHPLEPFAKLVWV